MLTYLIAFKCIHSKTCTFTATHTDRGLAETTCFAVLGWVLFRFRLSLCTMGSLCFVISVSSSTLKYALASPYCSLFYLFSSCLLAISAVFIFICCHRMFFHTFSWIFSFLQMKLTFRSAAITKETGKKTACLFCFCSFVYISSSCWVWTVC